MEMQIATVVGEDGITSALNSGGTVTVYKRSEGQWAEDRSTAFSLEGSKGLVEMRSRMGELVKFLGPCKILVAKSASGVPYFELEKAGFTVWEIPGAPESFLEQVWSEEEKAEAERAAPPPPIEPMPTPVEESPGNYAINIRDIQKCRPELSSKKVLQQFIRKGQFRTLVIVCDHVPPWIEMERSTVGFTMEAAREGKGPCVLKLTRSI